MRINRQLVRATTALTAALLFFALCDAPVTQAASGAPTAKYAIVYDLGGRGDNGINDLAGAGVDLARKKLALDQFALREVATDGTDLDRLTKIRFLANAGYNLIILVGAGFDAALKVATLAYPTTSFAIVNDPLAGGGQINITNLEFDQLQGAYIAGALAALSSKSGVIGLVSLPGSESALSANFVKGAQAVKKKIKLAQPAATTDLAVVTSSEIKQGADVIYSLDQTPASASLLLSLNNKKRPLRLIAHLPDGFFIKSAQYKGVLLGAIIERVDTAVFNLLARAVNNQSYMDVIDDANSIIGHRFNFKEGMDVAVTSLGHDQVSAVLKIKTALADGKIKLI
jgi:basic membrane protein A